MSAHGPDDPDVPPADETPDQTSDDTGAGWGDEAREESDAERDAWYLSERPPHHGT